MQVVEIWNAIILMKLRMLNNEGAIGPFHIKRFHNLHEKGAYSHGKTSRP